MKLMRDLVGATLSERYRLVSRIAGGGMGEVYRGHDLLLDRAVAVKILQPSLATDPQLVERFRAEARAAARLAHPNVVAVHDWGYEGDSTYYMVMEYVSGTDLRDVLVSRGSLESAHAAEITASICDALAVAHSVGLIHRDIKPENILLAREGTVKVADFGIAVVADSNLTSPGGAVPGTLRYLAPEQAGGAEATKASDIWAAGAVLSEMLTGMPPLQGSGTELLRRRAVEEPEPPSSRNSEVPPELDRVVLKACARRPESRYPDAAEMGQDLRSVAARSLEDAPSITTLLEQVTGEVHLPDMEPTFHPRSARRLKGRRRRSQRILRAALAILILVLVAVGGASAAPFLFGPSMVDVPELTGMTRAEAVRETRALGLTLEVGDPRRDPDVPEGEILDQSPQSGAIEEGSTLSVVISAGPPLTRVPDLAGMTLRQAERTLEGDHLELGRVTRRFSMKTAGEVIRQPSRGRRLEWGSRVDVVVSRGPQQIEVPPVAEMKEARAKQEIAGAGFTPVLVDAYSDEVPAGRVISTNPGPGAVAAEGSEIEIYVSIGPEYEKVRMPDVRNMTVKAATAKLESLGLRVDVERSCEGNIVVDTLPVPGTMVRENDEVALFVC